MVEIGNTQNINLRTRITRLNRSYLKSTKSLKISRTNENRLEIENKSIQLQMYRGRLTNLQKTYDVISKTAKPKIIKFKNEKY